MKVLVTGGKGQLASCLSSVWQHNPGEILLKSSSDLDFYSVQEIATLLRDQQITHIIHTSAYTAVDQAEDEPELAKKVNVDQSSAIAAAAKEAGVFVVYISTDFIYGYTDKRTPWSEDDLVQPQSVYGKTKLEGECALQSSGADHLIIRTSWLYSDIGKNFYLTMKNLLGQGRDLNVVEDQHGTPTSAFSLASFIFDYLHSEDHFKLQNEILNFSNEGDTTWFGFASEIRKSLNLPGSVSPIPSAEYPQKAKRPAYSVMDLDKLKSTGWENVSWEVALQSVVG